LVFYFYATNQLLCHRAITLCASGNVNCFYRTDAAAQRYSSAVPQLDIHIKLVYKTAI